MSKKKFYIRTESAFLEVKGEWIIIAGFEKYDFFIHRRDINPDWYQISEGKTGHSIAGGTNRLNAYEAAEESLTEHKAQLARSIRKYVKKYGLSPAYKNVVAPDILAELKGQGITK